MGLSLLEVDLFPHFLTIYLPFLGFSQPLSMCVFASKITDGQTLFVLVTGDLQIPVKSPFPFSNLQSPLTGIDNIKTMIINNLFFIFSNFKCETVKMKAFDCTNT